MKSAAKRRKINSRSKMNSRRKVAIGGSAIAVGVGVAYASNSAQNPSRAKATRKAQRSYNKAQTKINRADRRDERRSGIKRNASGKRRVKSTRTYGPGNVMVAQKALTAGRR